MMTRQEQGFECRNVMRGGIVVALVLLLLGCATPSGGHGDGSGGESQGGGGGGGGYFTSQTQEPAHTPHPQSAPQQGW